MLDKFRAISAGLCVITSAAITLGVLSPQVIAQSPASSNLSVNKDFELNIDRERIQRQDYRASTSISLGEVRARGVSLRVGAEVRASEIDMQLNNINGTVRFHADLEPLRERMRSGRPKLTLLER